MRLICMTDEIIISDLQFAIDRELHDCLDEQLQDYPAEYQSMLHYQLGWVGGNSGQEAQGKRIRPQLVLLAAHACGADWRKALPAAAAVELVHNFSLIHDDIQDCSQTRRGRETVWVKWGEAQAINAGDAMLTTAQLALFRLQPNLDSGIINQAVMLLQTACLKLTRGQYLDIAFEDKNELPMEHYWQMVEGKTGALLAACLGLGSLIGLANEAQWQGLMDFGSKIGAAFQVQDDWLGIWGKAEQTGKSTISDLVAKKKTYPVLLGIQNQQAFYHEWRSQVTVTAQEAEKLAILLEKEGVAQKTCQKFEELYAEAFEQLESLHLDGARVVPLEQAIRGLFGRIK
ncbi:polyprenyl synthetase family protein [bacterium]|nr:polyprenyl synthetase family protein [bacterium]